MGWRWVEIIFWSSLASVFYSYMVYPLLLEGIAFFIGRRKEQKKSSRERYRVSILMAVYNEEKIIEKKLKSIADMDYVLSDSSSGYAHIEVLVGSDASTDQTDSLIDEFSRKYPFVRLVRFPGRSGKAPIINRLAEQATGDIIVSTDANVIFSRRMLNELLVPFSDKRVGMVAANIIRSMEKLYGMQEVEKNYIRRENHIKQLQTSVSGILLGVEGGCYAIRSSLFEKVPAGYFMDDFFITMSVIQKGYRVDFAPRALCYEDIPDDIEEEFKRKTRISVGNYQNMLHYRKMLFNPFHRIFFHFISHKFLRWMTPFILLIATLCSWVCFLNKSFYIYTSLFLTGVLLLPVFGKGIYRFPLICYPAHFVYMNYALLKGFFVFLKKPRSSVWQPTVRAVPEENKS